MARGLYSAIGRGSDELVAQLIELFCRFDAELAAARDPLVLLPAHARGAGAAAVAAIRRFEARVGERTGVTAGHVRTPDGPALEVGNHDHLGFGAEHEPAARQVADALAALLTTLGATGTFAFTID